jgi:hypothetical protein
MGSAVAVVGESVRNVGVVYVDARGVGRRALLRIAAGRVVRGRMGGREVVFKEGGLGRGVVLQGDGVGGGGGGTGGGGVGTGGASRVLGVGSEGMGLRRSHCLVHLCPGDIQTPRWISEYPRGGCTAHRNRNLPQRNCQEVKLAAL